MSINKNALIRYKTLDRCFRNPGRIYFWEDLLNECNNALAELDPNSDGIQRRQLFDDIKFMESEQGWSIALERYRHGKKVYYRYDDLKFSIDNQSLNETEAKQLKSAIQLLSKFKGVPQFEFINEIIPAIESKLGLVSIEREVMSFENNLDYEGLKFITPLFNAIVNKRALTIEYQDFKAPIPYSINFHPYYLKQYNSRWFVFGYNELANNQYWNMALDRIKHLEESRKKYIETDVDWEEYFYDFIGVTKKSDDKVQTVRLWFSPSLAPYIITKPIHPTQKGINTENGLEVKIKVIPNYELEKLILSFGSNVKVISPESLKDSIFNQVKNTLKNYQ